MSGEDPQPVERYGGPAFDASRTTDVRAPQVRDVVEVRWGRPELIPPTVWKVRGRMTDPPQRVLDTVAARWTGSGIAAREMFADGRMLCLTTRKGLVVVVRGIPWPGADLGPHIESVRVLPYWLDAPSAEYEQTPPRWPGGSALYWLWKERGGDFLTADDGDDLAGHIVFVKLEYPRDDWWRCMITARMIGRDEQSDSYVIESRTGQRQRLAHPLGRLWDLWEDWPDSSDDGDMVVPDAPRGSRPAKQEERRAFWEHGRIPGEP